MNREWFSKNSPTAINDAIRESFHELSFSNQSLFEILDTLALGFPPSVLYEIESFALNHDVNLIHLNMDVLCQFMLRSMEEDPSWCIDNILGTDTLDLDDEGCFVRLLLENDHFGNNANLRDMEQADSSTTYWESDDRHFVNGGLSVGDLFVLISDSMHTAFSEVYYVLDSHQKLRKIGIKQFGSLHDLHVIIPVHVTRTLYDPILAYSAFIHQHTFESGGTVQLELQIDDKSHVFRPEHKTLSAEREQSIIASYGWNQKHHDGGVAHRPLDRVKEAVVRHYNPFRYSTVYTVTDMGWKGTLIAYVNHPTVKKINLSALSENATKKHVGYIVQHHEANGVVELCFKWLDVVVAGCFRRCTPQKLTVDQNIQRLIADFYRTRPVWTAEPGLESKGESIRMVDCSTDLDSEHIDWRYAISAAVSKFGAGTVELKVALQRDNGSVNVGIIKADRLQTFNDHYIDCLEESEFVYNTVGKCWINGVCDGGSIDQMTSGGVTLRLNFGSEQSTMECLVEKRTGWQSLRKINIDSDGQYRFLIGMCWKRDKVAASVRRDID